MYTFTLSTKEEARWPSGRGSDSIAQWLERRPPNTAVVGSSPGGDRHICACHIEVKLPPDK